MDANTITAEERARWRAQLKADAGIYNIHLKDMLGKALDALEASESRISELDATLEASTEETRACFSAAYIAADKMIPELQQKLDHAESSLSQAKRELERMERERDWLIREISSDEGPCERLGIDLPEWCTLIDECGSWSCNTEHLVCWRRVAAAEAAKGE